MKNRVAGFGRGALNLIAVLAIVIGLQILIRGRVPNTVGLTIVILMLLGSYLAGVRWIERRLPGELRPGAALKELPAGFALGVGLFSAVMLLLWVFGVYQPSGWGSVRPLAGGLLIALAGAVFEEIVFRGFLFRLTAILLGTWGALALTSVLFGAAHALNRGATMASSVAIALEAGVLLGAAYALTERLWLPIGLHLGWNFTEGSIFGMAVSGGTVKGSLIDGTLQGPSALTGGAFGPEASILAVVLCFAVGLVLLWRTVRLGRIEPPAWRAIRDLPLPETA